jgi:hypothetical protein
MMKYIIPILLILPSVSFAADENRCPTSLAIASQQRNAAMDTIVAAATEVQVLKAKVADLEKKLAEKNGHGAPAKP